MNTPLHDPRHPWVRLTAAARTVRDDRATTVPFGFATRVAALALGPERRLGSLFDLFALRALVVACLLAVASAAVNYGELSGWWQNATAGEDAMQVNDAVTVVLALAD